MNSQAGKGRSRKPFKVPMVSTFTLLIDDIIQDPQLQIRKGKITAKNPAVRSYANAYRSGQEMPPIKVTQLNGVYFLIAGWHRLAALRSIGEREVKAEIIPSSDLAEARWLAGEDNLRHGVRLRPSELRPVFKAYIDAGQNLRANGPMQSYRDIASALGGVVTHGTIRNWMKAYYPAIYAQMGKEDLPAGKRQEPPTLEFSLFARASVYVPNLCLTSWGLTDEKWLGVLIQEVEAVLAELKERPHGLPPPPPPPEDRHF